MGFDYSFWYECNKDKRNAARRKRYEEDAEYREKLLAQTREARRLEREKRRAERKQERKASKVVVTGGWKEFKIETRKGEVTAVTIGALARSIGCSIKALRDWERKGYIPETSHRSARGDRLYTPQMVLAIKAKVEKQGLDEATRPSRRYHTKKKIKYVGSKPVEVILFRAGTFAKLVGRNISSVLQMEKRGVLPETPFRSGGQRLYTYEMIEAARKVFEKWGGVEDIDWKKFEGEIRKAWKEQGVFRAKILSD